MILYRILTEDKNRAAVVARVARDFPSFTLIEASGYWQGAAERSLIIEIVGESADIPKIKAIAKTIKWANQQQAVLVQSLNLESELI